MSDKGLESAVEEPDLPELPPLDGLDEREDDGPAGGSVGELEPLPDEAPFGPEDETASELETGIELAGLPEPEPEATEGELVFDIGSLLRTADVEEEHEDEAQPNLAPEPDFGIVEVLDTDAAEADEGGLEPLEHLIDGELPGLDADEDGDFDPEADAAWLSVDAARDEEPPPWSAARWRTHVPAVAAEALAALALRGSILVAGGHDVIWIEPHADRVLRLAAGGGRIATLAVVGTLSDKVVYSTAVGRLMQRRRAAAGAEELRGWHDAVPFAGHAPFGVELWQTTDDAPDVILARTSTGLLLRSVDAGASFLRVELGAKLVALPRRGWPCAILVETATRRRLLRSPDAGASWQAFELDATAERVASCASPLIAAVASVVALADPSAGLVVSSDGGASYDRVNGLSGASAVVAGLFEGRACVWAALHHESRDTSEIVLVDAVERSAVRIAELRAQDFPPGDESIEHARVLSLEWEAAASRLWVAGAFGLRCLTPDD